MDKDAEIARLKALCKRYKAAAEKWERECKIAEKSRSNLNQGSIEDELKLKILFFYVLK